MGKVNSKQHFKNKKDAKAVTVSVSVNIIKDIYDEIKQPIINIFAFAFLDRLAKVVFVFFSCCCRAVTYFKGLPPIKSHDLVIVWSYKIM